MTFEQSRLSARIERELLPYVERPVRYVGGELHMVRKDLSRVALHGVFCFPDIYDIGMSHHGLQILYHIVNRREQWAMSRAFHPWTDAERIMRERSIPLWTLEYRSALAEADWLGFTLQYELQYTGLLNMLDLAGIPVRREARQTGTWPLIVAGGPCMCNPEPLAPFVDAFVIGDGERAIEKVCEVLEEGKRAGTSRGDVLAKLSEVEGVYVPSRYQERVEGRFTVVSGPVVRAARVAQLGSADYPERPLVPLIEVVHHRLAVEVMRGCTRGCRFCAAGMSYRPVRERPVEQIRDQIERSIKTTGWRDVGLLSLSTGDYGGLDPLLRSLRSSARRDHVSYSLPSTRIDSLGETQLDNLHAVSNSSSFTIAPEAGSQRLRDVINKGFTQEQILRTVDLLMARNVQTLKLYFMVGLPTETPEDITEIVTLVRVIAGTVRAVSGRRTVNVSVSPFSPKPGTPFQWEAMLAPDQLRERGASIKRALGDCRNVKVAYRDTTMTLLETLLGRGDRRVGDVVEGAWKLGAHLDGWDEHLDVERYRTAASQLGLDLGLYTAAIDDAQPLAWAHIQSGASMEFLRRERDMARAGIVTADCRDGECSACGVCGQVSRSLVDRVVTSEPEPAPEPARRGGIEFGRVPRAASAQSAQQVRFVYRVAYCKGPEVRFLGHLDMTNTILRALGAAGVPVAFSEGFHPHARVAFGPPLPLGAAGERELFDLTTTAPWSGGVGDVNRFLPAGLELVSARVLMRKVESISAAMVSARYRFAPLAPFDPSEAIRALMSSQSCVVEFEKKGQMVSRDIRPMVHELVAGAQGVFEARLGALPGATCTPANLVRAIAPAMTSSDFVITRVVCLDSTGVDLRDV